MTRATLVAAIALLGCGGEVQFNDEMGGDALHSPLMLGTDLNITMSAPYRNVLDLSVSSSDPEVYTISVSPDCLFSCDFTEGFLETVGEGVADIVVRDRGSELARLPIEVAVPNELDLLAVASGAPAARHLAITDSQTFLVDARDDGQRIFGLSDGFRLESSEPSVVDAVVFRSSEDPARAFARFDRGLEGQAEVDAFFGERFITRFVVFTDPSTPEEIVLTRRELTLSARVEDERGAQMLGAVPIWLIDGVVHPQSLQEFTLVPEVGEQVEVEACIRDVDEALRCDRVTVPGARYERALASAADDVEPLADLPPTGESKGCAATPWEAPALALVALVVLSVRRRGSSRARGERTRC